MFFTGCQTDCWLLETDTSWKLPCLPFPAEAAELGRAALRTQVALRLAVAKNGGSMGRVSKGFWCDLAEEIQHGDHHEFQEHSWVGSVKQCVCAHPGLHGR